MDDTACGKDCKFVKMGFCDTDEGCPNLLESWWKEGQTQTVKIVRDCVPKRLMTQLAVIQTRLEGVQCATEQVRNENLKTNAQFQELLNLSKQAIAHEQSVEKKLLE